MIATDLLIADTKFVFKESLKTPRGFIINTIRSLVYMKSVVSLIESPFEGGLGDVEFIINSYFSTQLLTCLKCAILYNIIINENIPLPPSKGELV
jgi:hypothetical protein